MELPEGLTLEKLFKEKGFTKTEKEVFIELAKGKSDQEIADTMFVVLSTSKYHVSSIIRKLKLKRRTQVMLVAYSLGVRP